MPGKKELTITRKLEMTLSIVLFIVLFGGLYAIRNLPFAMRTSFTLAVAFVFGWSILLISNIRKGEKNTTHRLDVIARLIFVLAVAVVILFGLRLVQFTDAADGMGTLIVGILLFVTAALVVIQARINRVENNLNEKLFQIESDLIALNGKMPVEGNDSKPDTEEEK